MTPRQQQIIAACVYHHSRGLDITVQTIHHRVGKRMDISTHTVADLLQEIRQEGYLSRDDRPRGHEGWYHSATPKAYALCGQTLPLWMEAA